jgi:hypothetical protein
MTARTSKMSPQATLPTFTPVRSGLLQRKCASGGTSGPTGECEACRTKKLQRRLGNLPNPSSIKHAPSSALERPPIVHELPRSSGQPLDAQTRAFMEPRLGHDFSRVSIHTDSRATKSNVSALALWRSGSPFVPERPPSSSQPKSYGPSAHPAESQADRMGVQIGRALESAAIHPGPVSEEVRALTEPLLGLPLKGAYLDVGSNAQAKATNANALAITEGAHVSFADGWFDPMTGPGRALIGHELTHVAQQRAYGETTVQRFALALNFEQLARDIEDAVSGPGTDETAIYRALGKLQGDPASVAELEAAYSRLFSESLMAALRGDLDDNELDYAKGLMGKPVGARSKQRIEAATPTTPAQWDALARRIKAAVEYKTFLFFGGTDEEAIFAVLRPLAGDANKIEQIKLAYARITRGPSTALVDAIKSELSGSELSYARELLAVPDPHAGIRSELSRGQVLAVRNELQPGSAVAPPPPPPVGVAPPPLPAPARWDGRAGAPNQAVNRAALKGDLTTDLTNHFNRVMPGIKAVALNPKLPVANLEGAANAAVEVTDDEYKSWYGVAATTPGQSALRSGFQFSQAAGNLLDATDPAARTAVGIPLSASSVANWMVRHDDPPAPPGGVEHMSAHSFNPDRRPDIDGENAWLQTDVINPFISPAARNADLLLYDQFGFALQPEPGKIVLPTTVAGSSLATGGAPNIADRNKLWRTWHLAVHEYLHNLAHPAFEESLSANNEGFTEYFTKGVVKKVAPVAHQNSGLVRKVEGGVFAPPTTPALVGPYSTPPTYAADLAHVENVAKTVPGGDKAIRAAYFQGHTEMLGIDPTTRAFAIAPPAAVDPTLVNVPAGIANLDDLATRSGVPKTEILAANSGLTAAGPLPPKLKLLGVREHKVVATFQPAGVVGPSETVDQIATQNGVSVQALKRANPSATWATLAAGHLILIPRH